MDKKAATLKMTKTVLMDMVKKKYSLPEDSRIEFVGYDPFTGTVELYLHSEEFDTLLDGEIPPKLDPEDNNG